MDDKTKRHQLMRAGALPWRLRWRVRAARMVLIWEILWSALWPATGFIGTYLALSFFDLWLELPGIVQFIAFVATLAGTAVSIWMQLRSTAFPSEADALRRLEKASGLTHRPLSSLGDELSGADATSNSSTQALWLAHNERQLMALEEVRADLPRSDLPLRDPMALRVLVAMVLLISLFFAGSDWTNRLGLAFQPSLGFSASGGTELTAWVNPPAFTGLAPIFLDPDLAGTARTLAVPQNSSLVLRIASARGTPVLKLPGKAASVKASSADGSVHDIAHALSASGAYVLKDRGRKLGAWRFSVTRDAVPFAAFEEAPRETEDNALELTYRLEDDYGVGSATIAFEVDALEANHEGVLASSVGERSFDVDLPLPSSSPKSVAEKASFNLTAHPFAGLDVTAQIVVSDLGGQVGRSEIIRLTLPERDFFEPLALAIVEQRRNLVRDPTDWAYVMRAIEALTLAPERFFDDLGVYVGMRTAYWQLDRVMPQMRAEVMPTAELLWDLALHIEDGTLSQAEREMKAIAQALMDALARGAPMDEIQRLLERYKQALGRYLAALAEENLAQDALDAAPPGDALNLTEQDLMDLLKAIGDLARTGDRSSAREMVAQLQRMLENMTASASQGMNDAESELARQIEGLSDLIGKERALMDETLRRSQQGDGAQGPGGDPLPGLAQEQGGLKGELEGVEPGLNAKEGAEGSGAGEALEDAAEAMGEAAKALGEGDTRWALHAQKRAIDNMREAAEEMARELMESMQKRGAAGQGGQDGDGGLDPLGRAQGKGGSGFGDHIKIPDERDLQRAREILQELQKRASDPTRPKLELDYLERLLKRF